MFLILPLGKKEIPVSSLESRIEKDIVIFYPKS
jgi:hypothetical protein